jgi:hypothetical protein
VGGRARFPGKAPPLRENALLRVAQFSGKIVPINRPRFDDSGLPRFAAPGHRPALKRRVLCFWAVIVRFWGCDAPRIASRDSAQPQRICANTPSVNVASACPPYAARKHLVFVPVLCPVQSDAFLCAGAIQPFTAALNIRRIFFVRGHMYGGGYEGRLVDLPGGG